MKWVDLPPIWLVFFIVLAWLLAWLLPGFQIRLSWQGPVAVVLLMTGAVLMGLAAYEMTRSKTTVIPKRTPNALVTSGVFRYSRNPIYLGDALVLTGTVIWLGSLVAVLLIPLFVWVIGHRFVATEEATLRAEFGDEFKEWTKSTRRWL